MEPGIIYLDIDGVILWNGEYANPTYYENHRSGMKSSQGNHELERFFPDIVHALGKLGANIVLSSSRRDRFFQAGGTYDEIALALNMREHLPVMWYSATNNDKVEQVAQHWFGQQVFKRGVWIDDHAFHTPDKPEFKRLQADEHFKIVAPHEIKDSLWQILLKLVRSSKAIPRIISSTLITITVIIDICGKSSYTNISVCHIDCIFTPTKLQKNRAQR